MLSGAAADQVAVEGGGRGRGKPAAAAGGQEGTRTRTRQPCSVLVSVAACSCCCMLLMAHLHSYMPCLLCGPDESWPLEGLGKPCIARHAGDHAGHRTLCSAPRAADVEWPRVLQATQSPRTQQACNHQANPRGQLAGLRAQELLSGRTPTCRWAEAPPTADLMAVHCRARPCGTCHDDHLHDQQGSANCPRSCHPQAVIAACSLEAYCSLQQRAVR